MISKLLLCPYFGEFPPWMDLFIANFARMGLLGYDILIDRDENGFRERVRDKLDIECPPMWGTGKIWDYRPALGMLYSTEITQYDFWGHIDFDIVLGRVDQFVTDEFLDGLDMHSNHDAYVNGCWSLYRNNGLMRTLFGGHPTWRWELECPEPTGWAETSYSQVMLREEANGRLRKAWTQWQVFKVEDLAEVHWEGDRLMLRGEEQMMAHFRRSKQYPPGCLL